MKGVDCPEDLQPIAVPAAEFKVFYEWVDPKVRPIDVYLSPIAVETIFTVANRLLNDLDAVQRSRKRAIIVTGYTDVTGDEAFKAELGRVIATCLKDLLETPLHMNGYAGIYDFPTTVSVLTSPSSRDGVREPLNRRASAVIVY